MEGKKQKIVGIVILAIVAVGFLLCIIGMCLDNITYTLVILGSKEKTSIGLFDGDEWKVITEAGKMGNTFGIISFVIALIGCAALAAYYVLRVFFKKDIAILGILSAIVAIVGGVLAFVASGVVCGQLNQDIPSDAIKAGNGYDPAAGAVLGLVGGLLAGIAGAVGLKKSFR